MSEEFISLQSTIFTLKYVKNVVINSICIKWNLFILFSSNFHVHALQLLNEEKNLFIVTTKKNDVKRMEKALSLNWKRMHLKIACCLLFIPDLSCDGMPPPDVLYCSMKCYEKGFTDGYCNSERRCICRNCRCSAWMFWHFGMPNNILQWIFYWVLYFIGSITEWP